MTPDRIREQRRAGRNRADDAEPAPATVLVVAGARLDPRALERELRAMNSRPVHFATAEVGDALDRVRAEPPDALVLCAGLERSGELVQQLREQAPETTLVVVDAAAGDQTALELELGPHDMALEGAAPVVVARCVAAALERRDLLRQLRQRTRELEDSRTRFRNIIQRVTDGIVLVGADGLIRFMNPAAEALFGRAAAELIGEEFGIPLVLEETAEIDVVRRDREEPIVAELRAAETQWNGESAQLVSLRDITDRKKAEQRAHRLVLEQASRERAEEASRRSRFLAEASATLDASLDLDTTLGELAQLMVPRLGDWCVIDLFEETGSRRVAGVHAQPERQPFLEQLKHGVPDSAAGMPRLLQADEVVLLRELDEAQLRDVTRDETQTELFLQLGTRSMIVVPLHSRQHRLGSVVLVCGEHDFGEADVALVEEIAARAGRAIENARLYHAALAASQAKSDFLAIVSHELRTPLNAIMGYTEMLLSGITGPLEDRQKARLRRIDASARHLLQLIEEILAHAGLESGREEARPQQFVLAELVDGVTAVAEPLVREKGLILRVDVPTPAATLYTDQGKVRQIVLNLLSNAVKFTDAGTVELHADVLGDELVIEVTDTGIGIAPEHHERIFEPFWQVEQPLTRHAEGTGLGLSVAQRLAAMLGGRIAIRSDPGAGSTFTLRVPARYRAVAQPVTWRLASR